MEASDISETLLNSWHTNMASYPTRQHCFIRNWDVHGDEHGDYGLLE
jgi:hypothetical protein